MTYTEQIAQTNIDLAKQKGIYDLIMRASSHRHYGIDWNEQTERKKELLAFSEAFAATDFSREGKRGRLSEKGNGLVNILNFHVDTEAKTLTGMNIKNDLPSFYIKTEGDLEYLKIWQEAGYEFIGSSIFQGTI
jgi:hypothetical protein